jgi:hypothetical protein
VDVWQVTAIVSGWYFVAAVVVRLLPVPSDPYSLLADPWFRLMVWVLSPALLLIILFWCLAFVTSWLILPPKMFGRFKYDFWDW